MRKVISLVLSLLLLASSTNLLAQETTQESEIVKKRDRAMITQALVMGAGASLGVLGAAMFKVGVQSKDLSRVAIGTTYCVGAGLLIFVSAFTNVFDANAATLPKTEDELYAKAAGNPNYLLNKEELPNYLLERIAAKRPEMADYLDDISFVNEHLGQKDRCLALDIEKIKKDTYAKYIEKNKFSFKITDEDLKDENFKFFLRTHNAYPEFYSVMKNEIATTRFNEKALPAAKEKYKKIKSLLEE